MMSAAEVRGTVLAYQRIRALLNQPLTDHTRERFEAFLRSTEEACRLVTAHSAPARWARSIVGPVLAAGLGAAIYLRDDYTNPGGALRVFGLAGERALTSQAAWKLMQPYIWEPVVSEQVLGEIRRHSDLQLHRLPRDPSPVDVLEELTRPRSGGFPVQVSHWLAEYFRESQTPYSVAYANILADLVAANDRGDFEVAQRASLVHGRFTREEWAELIRGRVPQSRLEVRASYLVVRQFLADYWAKWNPQAKRLAAG